MLTVYSDAFYTLVIC